MNRINKRVSTVEAKATTFEDITIEILQTDTWREKILKKIDRACEPWKHVKWLNIRVRSREEENTWRNNV